MIAASSSARSANSSAARSTIAARSATGRARQAANPPWTRSIAARTSSSVAFGISSTSSPVAGLVTEYMAVSSAHGSLLHTVYTMGSMIDTRAAVPVRV